MPPSGQDTSLDTQDQRNLKTEPIIEGYEQGGVVEIHRKDEVKFFRDIFEFYTATFLIIAAHVIYYFTGNILIALFLGQCKIISDHFRKGEVNLDKKNLSRRNEKLFTSDYRFNYPLWLCVFVEYATWIWVLCLFSDKVKFEHHYLTAVRPKNTAQLIFLSGVLGFLSSCAISAGHELIHKRDTLNKTIGTLVFSKFFYSHFMEEHTMGHHKLMGTPADGNTALKNESIWKFIVRECYMGHVASWKREFKRIRKHYGENSSYLSLIMLNKMTYYFILHVSYVAAIYHFLGWQSLKYQMLYTFWSIYFLDGGNYIEHYGLMRMKDKNGIYESVNKYHSWNHVGSPMYFKIQRHSDHHIASFRPYQILRRWDDAPWCPFQILSCFWTVPIWPLWFYCMNPRVDAIREFQEGKKGSSACFTNINSQLTDHDKWIKNIIWVYVSSLTLIFGYYAFFTNTFNTF